MVAAPRSKLFRAIVGLGLAAACGGVQQPSPDADAEAARDAGRDAMTMGDDAQGITVPAPDASATFDAGLAADVAADVAQEAWHPVPIA